MLNHIKSFTNHITNHRSNEAAFSLIEVLAALFVVSFTALPFAYAYQTHFDFNTKSEHQSGAALAAQIVLDKLRAEDFTIIPRTGNGPTEQVKIGRANYSVQLGYCKMGKYCTSDSVREIRCTVSLNGKKEYEVDTVYSQLR